MIDGFLVLIAVALLWWRLGKISDDVSQLELSTDQMRRVWASRLGEISDDVSKLTMSTDQIRRVLDETRRELELLRKSLDESTHRLNGHDAVNIPRDRHSKPYTSGIR